MNNQLWNKKNLHLIIMIMLLFIMGCPEDSPKNYFEKKFSDSASPSPPCDSPLAEAGQNQDLYDSDGNYKELVKLDASGSSEDIAEYEWFEVTDQGSKYLGTGQILYHDFSVGAHLVILNVTNGCGAKDKDALLVYIETPVSSQPTSFNQPPKAIAKVEDEDEVKTVLMTEASSISLDASGSYDPEGDTLYYTWTAFGQDGIEFNPNQYVASPKVHLPAPGDYHFILQVNDGTNFSEIDMLEVTVKQPDAWVGLILPDYVPVEIRFETIQSAIDSINNKRDIYDETEKIIAITSGVYKEKIIVKPYIYLIGLGLENGSVPHIVNFVNDNEAVITLDDYASINNLDISVMKKGPDDGNSSEKSAIVVVGEEANIINCKIQDSYSDGIMLIEGSYAEIRDTLFLNVVGEGIVGEKDSRLRVEKCRMLYTGGSAIWGKNAYSVEIYHSLIYNSGWHGFDLDCKNATIVEHCTIVDFGRWYDPNKLSPRYGIFCHGNEPLTIKSNLIEIQNKPALSGININSFDYSDCLKFNYIYSEEMDNKYYDGNITIVSVDQTNFPNKTTTTTDDPHIIDPYNDDFRLDLQSPAAGRGEKKTNPGANGDILRPYVPTPPKLSSPLNSQLVDPNDLIFRWERSEDPDGNSDKIKYSIIIYEDGDKDKDDFNDDMLVFLGWDIRNTSINFKELKPLEKGLEPGKRYWWCVQAMDEDGYKSSIQKGEWRCFDTHF